MRPAGAASTALWIVAYGDDFEPDPPFEPVGATNTASEGTPYAVDPTGAEPAPVRASPRETPCSASDEPEPEPAPGAGVAGAGARVGVGAGAATGAVSGPTPTSSNAIACGPDDFERYDHRRVPVPEARREALVSTAAACQPGTAWPSTHARASIATAPDPATRDWMVTTRPGVTPRATTVSPTTVDCAAVDPVTRTTESRASPALSTRTLDW